MATQTHERAATTEEARRYLEYALDPSFTREMAAIFGNAEPAPAEIAFYDAKLSGTGELANYLRPEEVAELYNGDREFVMSRIREERGTTKTQMALSPDLLKMPEALVYAVIDHEKSHGAQPKGKLAMKGIHAYTPFGVLPLGEMLVEGWAEYGLERKGRKPPSRYFDEIYGHGKTAYSRFRDLVYEVEEQSPGITRQIMRAARRGGPNAAIRLIEGIPNIENIVTKYACSMRKN
ncbi:MAG: hypothetical protein HYT72_02875 [Candidatus Aenigmarchaeota archaeon]|nr:hypothetical protein [Candidatus Aenigmarchaeota archaeon]